MRDCLSYTAGVAAARLAASPPHDDLLGAIPSNDSDIAARSVLGAFGPSAAQIDAARWFGTNGGIGTLVVAHGANNALRSVVDKNPVWSDTGYDTLDGKAGYTVWRPTHFALEYGSLVDAVRADRRPPRLLATVPHVTVAPIANGVNPDAPGQKWRDGSRYFPYYTDPWIDEPTSAPTKHRHLTHQQARAIDSAIDQYNATIADARAPGAVGGTPLVPVRPLRRARRPRPAPLHRRRRGGRRNGVGPRTSSRLQLHGLDTRFFRSDRSGRLQGGLFGLDGVHPTVSGYAVLTGAVLDVLAAAGVAPKNPPDYAALRRRDALNSDPPALMTTAFDLVTPFLNRLVSRRRA